MKFLKTCYNCGKKVKELRESKCEDCFREETPPVKEIKELNLKTCNKCKKIHYNNALLTREELEELLPTILGKRIVMNEGYELNSASIENLEFKASNISFDIKIDSTLKD